MSEAATGEIVPFWKVPEVAAVLGCDERTVRRKCAAGDIEARKCGRRGPWLIFPAWIEQFCLGATVAEARQAAADETLDFTRRQIARRSPDDRDAA